MKNCELEALDGLPACIYTIFSRIHQLSNRHYLIMFSCVFMTLCIFMMTGFMELEELDYADIMGAGLVVSARCSAHDFSCISVIISVQTGHFHSPIAQQHM